MTPSRHTVLVLSMFAMHLAGVHAQQDFPHLGPQAPSPSPRWVASDIQAALASAHTGWQRWSGSHPGWTALFDQQTGAPAMAFGPGIRVCGAGAEEAEVREAAVRMGADVADLLGLPTARLDHTLVIETPDLWYVHLLQEHGTFHVKGGRVCLRIDRRGRLLMWTARLADTDGLPSAPSVKTEDAITAARDHLEDRGWATAATTAIQTSTEHWIHLANTPDGERAIPAVVVKLAADEPRGDWVVWIDARTGEVFDAWNDLREHADCQHGQSRARAHVGCEHDDDGEPLERWLRALLAMVYGTVEGTVHEGRLPYQAPVSRPFRDIYVNVGNGYTVTNANGDYSYNGGPPTLNLSCYLDGPFIHGQSNSFISASHQATVSSGLHDIFFGSSSSTVGERDMVYFTNKTHARLKMSWPNLTLLDNQISGYSDLTSGTCNAFYSPQLHSINFYSAGGGCNDMATSSTVVAHEYGHGVTSRIYGYLWAWLPGHLGEGYSDCIAAATEDTPLMGAGYRGVGTLVRDLDNSCQYPASCGTQIHSRGKVIGGCYWHTREQFAAASGQAGKDYMDAVFFQHLAGAPSDEVFALADMLLLDDNDGNLANGTPNDAYFHQAFTVMHGVPWPLQTVTLDHLPVGDTTDQVQDYEIVAEVGAFTGSPINAVDLHWSAGGASWNTTSMSPTSNPDIWSGTIPNQAGVGTVRYYIAAFDSAGNGGTHPQGAPNDYHSFETVGADVFVYDDFETPSGWTTGFYWNQDDWMNLSPGNGAHPYDPPAAFDGAKVWGNDLSPNSSWDGYYRPWVDNWLESPPFDCTGRSGVRVRYRRWLTVEDGLYDQALIWISNDGGNNWTVVWQNAVGQGDHIDTSWVPHEVDISSIADNEGDVRVVFELVSDGIVQYGGWTVDAFQLVAHDTTPVLSAPSVAAPWSTWVLSAQGDPGDLLFIGVDQTLNATTVPGVGTLSLDYLGSSFFNLLPFTPLGGTGTLDLPLVVPRCSGTTWHFQGVLLRPLTGPLITNVLDVTVQ